MTAPARLPGIWRQHIAWIAVVRQRADEAVIAGITHRRIEVAVDHHRAGVLVHFILDRFAADGTSMMTLTSCGGLI
jgi:hypothetical protein